MDNGVHRCSKLLRSLVLHPDTEDWDMDNAMTNLATSTLAGVIPSFQRYDDDTRGTRKLVQTHLGPDAKRVILAVAYGGSVPDVLDANKN